MGSYIMSVIHKTYQVKAYKLLEISKSHVTVAIIGNDLIAYEKKIPRLYISKLGKPTMNKSILIHIKRKYKNAFDNLNTKDYRGYNTNSDKT